MKVLIDTNILISAALNSKGTPYLAFVKAVSYPNHGIICEQILMKCVAFLIENFRTKYMHLKLFCHLQC